MKRMFFLVMLLVSVFFLATMCSLCDGITIKVERNKLDPVTELEEREYGDDCIGVGFTYEEEPPPEVHAIAEHLVDKYISEIDGYRPYKPWNYDVFRSPKTPPCVTKLIKKEEVREGVYKFSFQDYYSEVKDGYSLIIEYFVAVCNNDNEFILKIGCIAIPFYQGWILVRPTTVIFLKEDMVAPAPPKINRRITTFGAIKSDATIN